MNAVSMTAVSMTGGVGGWLPSGPAAGRRGRPWLLVSGLWNRCCTGLPFRVADPGHCRLDRRCPFRWAVRARRRAADRRQGRDQGRRDALIHPAPPDPGRGHRLAPGAPLIGVRCGIMAPVSFPAAAADQSVSGRDDPEAVSGPDIPALRRPPRTSSRSIPRRKIRSRRTGSTGVSDGEPAPDENAAPEPAASEPAASEPTASEPAASEPTAP